MQLGPTCAFYAFANAIVQTQKIPKKIVHQIVQKSIQQLRPKTGAETKKERETFTYVGEVFSNAQTKAMIEHVAHNILLNPTIQEHKVEMFEQLLSSLNEGEIILLPIQLIQKVKKKKIQNVHWISIYKRNKKNYYINPNYLRTHKLSNKKLKEFIVQSTKVKSTCFNWNDWFNSMVDRNHDQYRYKLSLTKRLLLPLTYCTFFDDLFNQPYTKSFFQSINKNTQVNFKDLHIFKISFSN